MSLYFSYDPEGDGFLFHDTETEAKDAAESALQGERECAPEGWSESVGLICWGEVVQKVKETLCRPATEEDNLSIDIELYAEYELLPVSVDIVDEDGEVLSKEDILIREENVKLREALSWYASEAKACAKNIEGKTHAQEQGLLASLTVLSLDGGKRAEAAMSSAQSEIKQK